MARADAAQTRAPDGPCPPSPGPTRAAQRAQQPRRASRGLSVGAALVLALSAVVLSGPAYDAWSFVKIFYLRVAYPSAAAPEACTHATPATVDIGLLATYPAPETTPWHALAGASNASNDAAPLRVTLVTLCTAALDHLCAASIDNKRAYAQRHGYKLFVAPDDLIDPSRPVAWSKLRALQAALADGAHLVAWFDADALVMAPHIRLEDIAQQAGPHAAHILAADHRGPNTGVWLLRACPWSAALLQHMWDAGDTYAALRPAQCVFRYEQRALHFLLQSALWRSTMVDGRHGQRHVYMAANGVRERTALVHTCVLNSLPSWYRPGHFVVHLAGVKGAARCLLFRRAYSVASAAAGRVPGADGVPAGPTWWQCIAASTRWQLT